MIYGIGVDAVEIERFKNWHTFSFERLSKIFTINEIEYCLSIPKKSAERFAVRFAAKEAFYKALSIAEQEKPFLKVASALEVVHGERKKPFLKVDWQCFLSKKGGVTICNPLKVHISLSHTKTIAIAVILIEM